MGSFEPNNAPHRIPDIRPTVGDFRGNLSSVGFNNGTVNPSPVMPPPLPPRPVSSYNNNSFGGMNSFGGGYSPYSNNLFNSNPYSGYGGGSNYFNNYGGGGGMYGGMYNNQQQESDFVRLAEQNSRNAFQSVESVVYAFNSVSQMLESTLNAFYSSFRAVLGVADQFSRLRNHFTNIFTTLALVRFVRWLWRRVLVLLRLRSAEFAERAWSSGDLSSAAEMLPSFGAAAGGAKPSTNWALMAFFAVAIGGPLLIYKLMAKIMSSVEESKRWATGHNEHYTAVALYDFTGNSQQELSLIAGQQIRLAPKNLQPQVKGWLLGSVDGQQTGLVPANYIRVLGRSSGETDPNTKTFSMQSNSIVPSTSSFEQVYQTKLPTTMKFEQVYNETKFQQDFDEKYEKTF